MKYLFQEAKADYENYDFPYKVNAYFEDGDNIQSFFSQGLLPTRTTDKNKFYMARSIRINLSEFEPSSENRRIMRKTEWLTYESKPLSEFNFDFTVQKFCKDYFDHRFGAGKMSAQAIKRIFTESWNNQVYIFKDSREEKIVGYAAMYVDANIAHYAYPFYDLNYFKDSLGARMMLTAIMDAKEQGKNYIYLGTLYEKRALYKTEFKGFEWWDGNEWNADIEALKLIVQENVPQDQ